MALCSSHFVGKVLVVGAAALGCAFASAYRSPAQPTVTNSGTLTCTVADVANNPNAIIDLACNFKAQSGATSDYVGSAATKTGGFPPAKFVFVWTVVAIDAGNGLLLEGTFSAQTGREGPPVLIGGKDGTTRLEPAAGKDQVPGPGAITALTLKRAATKT